jgi:hypothetical protein
VGNPSIRQTNVLFDASITSSLTCSPAYIISISFFSSFVSLLFLPFLAFRVLWSASQSLLG